METSGPSELSSRFTEGRVLYKDGSMVACPSGISDAGGGSDSVAGSLIDPFSRHRKERIQDFVIGALILAIVMVSGIIFTLQFPVPLRKTPVVVTSIYPSDTIDVCPGDSFDYAVDVDILEPGILSLSVGVIDLESGDTLRGTTGKVGPFPRDEPVSITESGSFVVPDLPPGEYKRVMAIDLEHADSVPVMWDFKFSIGEHCSK